MQLTSPVFQPQGEIPSKYTCDGDLINPPLQISDVSENTKTLALIVEDPDAPVGLWIHWMIWNIDPTIKEIPAGATNIGVVGKNSSKNNTWDDICPPDREHRYFFKLFALDVMIGLNPETVTREEFYKEVESHTIEKAELMGRYNRVDN